MPHPLAAIIAQKMAKGDVPDDSGDDELTTIGHQIADALGTKLDSDKAKQLAQAIGDLIDVHEGGGSDQPDDAAPEAPEPDEGAMPPEGEPPEGA